MEKRFPRSLETLPVVIEAVSSYCSEQGAAGDSAFAISFAVEEIFTNMVKYNPKGPSDVLLSLGRRGSELVVTMEDEQEHDFDPTASPDPAFEKALSDRKPGGLGLYLIRKMVRNVEYRRDAQKSIITLTHPLE